MNSKIKIEMGKKYRTTDRRPVRILCTDYESCTGRTVVAILTHHDGSQSVEEWYSNGYFLMGDKACKADLVEVTPYDDLKVDDKVIVWDNDDPINRVGQRHFSHIEGSKIYCFAEGRTSWTANGPDDIIPWDNCKKADD